MKITLHKQGDVYMPYDDEAVALTKKKPEGSLYVVDIKQSRNPKFHSYAMTMLTKLYEMVDTELDFNPWRKMLTVKAGYFTSIGKVDINGTTSVAVIPDSLSFENMEEEEFQQCFKAIHRAFCSKYGDILTYNQLCEWAEMR